MPSQSHYVSRELTFALRYGRSVVFISSLRNKRNLARPSSTLLQIQRLAVAVALQTTHTPLRANTRFLVPAEWHPWIKLEMGIDPDVSGLELMGDLIGAVETAGPDGGSEAVERVVGFGDGFFVGGEAEEWDDRACDHG